MPESNPLPFHPQIDIIEEILKELKHIKKLRPYPEHVCAQAARVSAAAGFLSKVADDVKYSLESPEEARRMAISVAAQAIRFIEHV